MVRGAKRPYPKMIEDDKLVVWGETAAGRLLQVICVFKSPGEVSYQSLSVDEWMRVESGEATVIIRVIHAMDLTPRMKRNLKKSRR